MDKIPKGRGKADKQLKRAFVGGDNMEGVFDEEVISNVTNFEIMLVLMEKREKGATQRYGSL